MVDEHIHDLKERKATPDAPYHFLGSGLPNVYLLGIKYKVCKICGSQSADIPAIKQLMKVIGKALVESDAPLTGPEIRFLRKRLGKKSSDFARLVGVTVEQVSRWENGHNPPERSADKLIRILYLALSGDRKLRGKITLEIESWMYPQAENGQASEIRAKLRNHEWEADPVLTSA
jgi:putative zinc finger/helix-turn-helix YgiT family protein